MVNKIPEMISDDCRLKLHELANTVDVSKSAVESILTENLNEKEREMGEK